MADKNGKKGKELPFSGQILVVDDTPANLKLLVDMLGHAGYQIRAAGSGPLALRSIAVEAPDLILLDIRMPGMDGFEVCRKLKSDDRYRDIPVIFLSALHSVPEKIRAFESGAVDYVTKPFEPEEILARIHTHLTLRNLHCRMEILVKKRTEELERSLEEKEILLREVHHRVKNNLQIIISMMNLQNTGSDNSQLSDILQTLQNRVLSMALVHDLLYHNELMTGIDFEDYVRRLCGSLLSSFNMNESRIDIQYNLASMNLNLFQAIPCGLILNELLTNALKHAFPDGGKGTVIIEMGQKTPDHWLLRVKDNGAGLPDDFDVERSDTLGLMLVNNLVRQLEGTLRFRSSGGTEVMITFPSDKRSAID
ncbi:MAG: response regulator [Spirochaetales bacterium]|nr:response regulator [Spirochaetales bacterium]